MSMTRLRHAWEIWCKSLGSKAYEKDSQKSDRVAMVRSFWVLLNGVTCVFIILNAIATVYK